MSSEPFVTKPFVCNNSTVEYCNNHQRYAHFTVLTKYTVWTFRKCHERNVYCDISTKTFPCRYTAFIIVRREETRTNYAILDQTIQN